MTKRTKIFGPPGSGKTTTAINLITESSVPLDKIAYVTFGRKAMDDMKQRMYARGITDHSLPYFRTIHGLLFNLLKIRKEQIADMRLAEFCKEKRFKLTIARGISTEDLGYIDMSSKTLDDEFYQAMQRDRTNLKPFSHVPPALRKYGGSYLHFKHAYMDWLREHDYIDFIGIIERGIKEGVIPPVDILFVDEWQDLNQLQVAVVSMWADNIETSYHIGDDDQTIYAFSGASPRAFLDFPCDEECVLGETFRLPSDVLALSQEIITRNKNRHHKAIITKKGAGSVFHKSIPSACSMIRAMPKGDTCFVLVRNNFVIPLIMRDLAKYGVPVPGLRDERNAVKVMQTLGGKGRFAYDDVEALCVGSVFPSSHYFSHGAKNRIKKLLDKTFPVDGYTFDQMLSFGLLPNFFVDLNRKTCANLKITSENLTYIMRLFDTYGYDFTPVSIMTIHQSKGLEADTVILVPDITSDIAKTEGGKSVDTDAIESERRVWYTAVTRARKQLIILDRTNYSNYKTRFANMAYVFVNKQKTPTE